MERSKKFNIYRTVWNFSEDFYSLFGFNIFAPLVLVFPNFSPWLFGKMIGAKGVEVEV